MEIESRIKINSTMTACEAQGFEIYHFAREGMENLEMQEKYREIGFINTYKYYDHDDEAEYALRRDMGKKGARFWVYGNIALVKEKVTDVKYNYSLEPDYKEQIAKLVDDLKKQGIWEYILGFDFDEPMLHTTNEIFTELSAEFAKYGKRMRGIFSSYEIMGTHPDANDPEYGLEAHLITKESCRYLTDIGWDQYSSLDYDYRKKVCDEMKRLVGRDDVYVWHVPCVWSFYNRFGQEHAIKHLNLCYEMLLEEKNPGGLTCYNWVSFRKEGESLDWIFAEENKSRWYRLEERMIEIGNEIIKKPLNKFY